jgi:hypothetical protein
MLIMHGLRLMGEEAGGGVDALRRAQMAANCGASRPTCGCMATAGRPQA